MSRRPPLMKDSASLRLVSAVDRALAVDTGLDRVVVLAADAVQTLVDVLVDVAVVVDRREELLHALVVARFGRADEVVVVDVEGRPGVAKLLGFGVRPLLG